MKSESIGFIGIGNVGSKLANNLLKSNNNVFVYDKNKKSYSRLKKLIAKCPPNVRPGYDGMSIDL